MTLHRRHFITAAVAACAAPAARAAAANMTLDFMLDFTPHGLHAPYFLAQRKGWFKEAGLSVNIQDGKGSVSVIQLAGAGRIDIGHAALGAMAIAQTKGVPVKAVASVLRTNPVGVLFSKGASFKGPADLKGKELIYTPSSLESPFVDSFLAVGKLGRGDVKLLATDITSKISTYLSGRGDAVVAPIPYMRAVMGGKRDSDWLRFTDFGMPMLDYGMVAAEDTLKAKPEALAAFNRVVAKAFAHVLNGGLDEGVAAIVESRPEVRLDKRMLAAQFNAYAEYLYTPATQGLPIGHIAARDWDDTAATLKKLGLIPAQARATDFYTAAFLPR